MGNQTTSERETKMKRKQIREKIRTRYGYIVAEYDENDNLVFLVNEFGDDCTPRRFPYQYPPFCAPEPKKQAFLEKERKANGWAYPGGPRRLDQERKGD